MSFKDAFICVKDGNGHISSTTTQKKKKEIGIVRESQNFLGIGNGFYQMSNDRKIV